MTFEELQRARSDGSDMVYRKPNTEKKGSRANKNRFSRGSPCAAFVVLWIFSFYN